MRSPYVLACALLLQLMGCAHGPLTVSPTALSGFAHRRLKVLPADEGGSVRIGERSSLKFERRDGTFTPWLPAAKLYTNAEGVVAWYQVPLENVRAIRIEGMHPSAQALLEEIVPEQLRKRGPDGAIELTLPGALVEEYMARIFTAVGRRWAPKEELREETSCPPMPGEGAQSEQVDSAKLEEWKSRAEQPSYPCGTQPKHVDYRAQKYLRQQLLGQPLGRWTFRALLAGVQGPFEGMALFIVHEEGMGIPDGLLWTDIKSVKIRRAPWGQKMRAGWAKVGMAVALAPLALAAAVTTEAVQSLSPRYAIGRAAGTVRNEALDAIGDKLGPLVESAGEAAIRTDLPEGPRPTGTALWREGLKLPPIAGTQSLVEGRPIPPWSPESLLFVR